MRVASLHVAALATWLLLLLLLHVAAPAASGLGLTGRPSRCDAVVRDVFRGDAGPVRDVFRCAAALRLNKDAVVAAIGPAFREGQPETIVERVVANETTTTTTTTTTTAYRLRLCVYGARGIVAENGTLERAALERKLRASVRLRPPAKDVVAAALRSCPQPHLLQISSFISCVTASCIREMPENVANSPFYEDEEEEEEEENGKKCKKKKKGRKCRKH